MIEEMKSNMESCTEKAIFKIGDIVYLKDGDDDDFCSYIDGRVKFNDIKSIEEYMITGIKYDFDRELYMYRINYGSEYYSDACIFKSKKEAIECMKEGMELFLKYYREV